jgi:hypothetical protein
MDLKEIYENDLKRLLVIKEYLRLLTEKDTNAAFRTNVSSAKKAISALSHECDALSPLNTGLRSKVPEIPWKALDFLHVALGDSPNKYDQNILNLLNLDQSNDLQQLSQDIEVCIEFLKGALKTLPQLEEFEVALAANTNLLAECEKLIAKITPPNPFNLDDVIQYLNQRFAEEKKGNVSVKLSEKAIMLKNEPLRYLGLQKKSDIKEWGDKWSKMTKEERRTMIKEKPEQEFTLIFNFDLQFLQGINERLVEARKGLHSRLMKKPRIEKLKTKRCSIVIMPLFRASFLEISSRELIPLLNSKLDPHYPTDRRIILDNIASVGETLLSFEPDLKDKLNLYSWSNCRNPIYHAVDLPASHEALIKLSEEQEELCVSLYEENFPELSTLITLLKDGAKDVFPLKPENLIRLKDLLYEKVWRFLKDKVPFDLSDRLDYLQNMIAEIQKYIAVTAGAALPATLTFDDYCKIIETSLKKSEGPRVKAQLILYLKEFGQIIRQLPSLEQMQHLAYEKRYLSEEHLTEKDFLMFKKIVQSDKGANILMFFLEFRTFRGLLAHRLGVDEAEIIKKIAYLFTMGSKLLNSFSQEIKNASMAALLTTHSSIISPAGEEGRRSAASAASAAAPTADSGTEAEKASSVATPPKKST